MLKNRIIKFSDNYDYIGIRVQEEPFTLGPIYHVSHIWDDGEDTGEELDGICTINGNADNLEALAAGYNGDHIAILASNQAEYGEDAHELILRDAEVIDIIS